MQIKQNKNKRNNTKNKKKTEQKNEKLRTKKRPSTKQITFVTLKNGFCLLSK